MPKLYEIDLEKGVEGTPIPPVFERTVHIPAGDVTFGVEYRWLTLDVAKENFDLNVAEGRNVLDDVSELVVEPAEGVSIHVFGTEGGEFLRFDCFDVEPHYHYIDPDQPWVNRFTYDPVANGDMLDWTLQVLRTRIVTMLQRTPAGARLAARVDPATLAAALDEVEVVARDSSALRSSRPFAASE